MVPLFMTTISLRTVVRLPTEGVWTGHSWIFSELGLFSQPLIHLMSFVKTLISTQAMTGIGTRDKSVPKGMILD